MRLDIDIARRAAGILFSRHPKLELLPVSIPGLRGWRFRFRLPHDVAAAFGLMKAVDSLAGNGLAQRSFNNAHKKLLKFLGWRWDAAWLDPREGGFFRAIRQDPGDLSSWAAYADWLQEQGKPRGEVIAAWLRPSRRKAVAR
jgi:uncharacterized protein (TIGR02996 family)